MRLRGADLQGIRGLPSRAWDFPAPGSDVDVIAVTGPRGSGKTTFLEAILAAKERVAAYGVADPRWSRLIPDGARSAKVTLTWELSAAEMDRLRVDRPQMDIESILGEPLAGIPRLPPAAQTLLGTLADPPIGRVIYFHDSRQLTPPASIEPERAARPFALTSRNNKFGGVYSVLTDRSRSAQRDQATALLKTLCPELSFVGVTSTSGVVEPLLARAGSSEIPYAHLSLSEQQAALFALTFASVGLQDSVIIVDTPELAFGEVGAVELVRALLQWGTSNQLVLATTSRELLAAVPRGRVVELGSSSTSSASGAT